MVCFFKQKTAYEMRISDWSSDVCSSDLEQARRRDSLGIDRDADSACICEGLTNFRVKILGDPDAGRHPERTKLLGNLLHRLVRIDRRYRISALDQSNQGPKKGRIVAGDPANRRALWNACGCQALKDAVRHQPELPPARLCALITHRDAFGL